MRASTLVAVSLFLLAVYGAAVSVLLGLQVERNRASIRVNGAVIGELCENRRILFDLDTAAIALVRESARHDVGDQLAADRWFLQRFGVDAVSLSGRSACRDVVSR